MIHTSQKFWNLSSLLPHLAASAWLQCNPLGQLWLSKFLSCNSACFCRWLAFWGVFCFGSFPCSCAPHLPSFLSTPVVHLSHYLFLVPGVFQSLPSLAVLCLTPPAPHPLVSLLSYPDPAMFARSCRWSGINFIRWSSRLPSRAFGTTFFDLSDTVRELERGVWSLRRGSASIYFQSHGWLWGKDEAKSVTMPLEISEDMTCVSG